MTFFVKMCDFLDQFKNKQLKSLQIYLKLVCATSRTKCATSRTKKGLNVLLLGQKLAASPTGPWVEFP